MSDYVQGIVADNRAYQVKDLDARFTRQYRDMLRQPQDEEERWSDPSDSPQSIEDVAAEISINALILFIESLLIHQSDTAQRAQNVLGERDHKENYLAPWARSIYSEKNSYGVAPAHAVSAYKAASKTAKPHSAQEQSGEMHNAYWKKERLENLLLDLKVLRRAQVQYLVLDMQNDSFMQGIAQAVERALSML